MIITKNKKMFKKNVLILLLFIFSITFVNAEEAKEVWEINQEYGEYLKTQPDRDSTEFKAKRDAYNTSRKESEQIAKDREIAADKEYKALEKRCWWDADCIMDENDNGIMDDTEQNMTPDEIADEIKQNKIEDKLIEDANKDLDEAEKLKEEACASWSDTQECKDASEKLEWASDAKESAENWVNSGKSSWYDASVWWSTRKLGSNTIKDGLMWISQNEILPSWDDWLWVLQSIFIWIKTSLTGLLLIIAVWVFLFIWVRLGLARWNPEEFKKGIMQLVYAIVWIFIVAFAWAAVTLIAWLKF